MTLLNKDLDRKRNAELGRRRLGGNRSPIAKGKGKFRGIIPGVLRASPCEKRSKPVWCIRKGGTMRSHQCLLTLGSEIQRSQRGIEVIKFEARNRKDRSGKMPARTGGERVGPSGAGEE